MINWNETRERQTHTNRQHSQNVNIQSKQTQRSFHSNIILLQYTATIRGLACRQNDIGRDCSRWLTGNNIEENWQFNLKIEENAQNGMSIIAQVT